MDNSRKVPPVSFFRTKTRLASLLPLLGAALVAVLVYFTSIHFIENTAQRVMLRGIFPQDTLFVLSSIAPLGAEREVGRIRVKGSHLEQEPRTAFLTAPIGRLKIVAQPGRSHKGALTDFNINRIAIEMPYGTDQFYTGSLVNESYESDQYLEKTRQLYRFDEDSRVEMLSTQNIGSGNVPLRLFLCVLFFSGFYILFRHLNLNNIPAIRDMTFATQSNTGKGYDAINGVRGLAALLVLFSHSAPGFSAVQMGLALLFVISGFLLSKPFIRDPEAIFSVAKIETYLLKRMKRILPMYYTFITLNFLLVLQIDDAIRHFLFVQGDGHLWPMTQIFAFYMLLPFILLITSACYRIHRLLPLVLLAATFFAWVNYLLEWTPFFNGRFYNEFFFYAFITGVFGAYLQYDWIEKTRFFSWSRRTNTQSGTRSWPRHLLALTALTVTVLTIAWSAPFRLTGEINFWISQFYIKCVLALLIIMLAVNSINTWYHALIANSLFRAVGVVGFSFYLLHGIGIQITQTIQSRYLLASGADERSWTLTIVAFVITYLLAVVTYSYIERPFFGRSTISGRNGSNDRNGK